MAAAKGDNVDRGGGAEPEGKESPTETGAKAWKKRKLGVFFIALRVRGKKHGQ